MKKKLGIKHDKGKLPYDLIPWDAMDHICKVLRFGATKYAPRNWEKGMTASQLFAATTRHLKDWFQYGIDKDPETGFHPLAHALCEMLFGLALWLRGKLHDDRPKTKTIKRP